MDTNLCVSSYIKNIKDELYAFAYKNKKLTKVSKEAVAYCKDVSDALEEGVEVSTILFKATTEIDKKLLAFCLDFTSSLISLNQQSEDAFIDKYLKPLIRQVILSSCDQSTIYSGSDAPDPNTASKKKADFMLGYVGRKRQIYFFFVEVKRPNRFSKYQVEDDTCKLMKHLKDSVDIQASVGIESPLAIGLLCEGFVCSLIEMTLVEEGIYLPVTRTKFKLPESSMDVMNIPKAVECLFFVLEEVRKFEAKYTKRSKDTNVKNFVKPTFTTKFVKTKASQR